MHADGTLAASTRALNLAFAAGLAAHPTHKATGWVAPVGRYNVPFLTMTQRLKNDFGIGADK